MLALLLVLAASADGGAAASGPDAGVPVKALSADKLLSTCRRSVIMGGWTWSCDGLTFSVVDVAEVKPEALAAGYIGRMREDQTAEVSTWSQELELGKKRYEGFKVEVRRLPRRSLESTGALVLAPQPRNLGRMAYCGATLDSPHGVRCSELLARLVATGPPKNVKLRPDELPRIGGKPVSIPEGCVLAKSLPGFFQIDCGQSAALSVMGVTSPELLPERVTAMHQDLLQLVEVSSAGPDKACKVGGVATTCKTLVIGDLGFTVGGAVVGGAPTLIFCAQPKGLTGYHPLCARVLSN